MSSPVQKSTWSPGQPSPVGMFLRRAVAPFLSAAFRVRVLGRGAIPAGPVIYAGNHVSYMDPVLLWCNLTMPVHFMAKKEMFSGALAWPAYRVWAFPVDRQGADRSAIQAASDFLAAGESVGIFPEGTRAHGNQPGEAHGGVAFIAMRAGVPVVPVGIAGTENVWPRGQKLPRFKPVTVKFGEPVYPSEFEQLGGRKERVEAMTERIMERIGQELGEARRVHDAR